MPVHERLIRTPAPSSAEVARALMLEHVDTLVARLHALTVNDCLFSGVAVLDASGQWSRSWQVPFAGVVVANLGSAEVVVVAGSAAAGAPASGAGMQVVGSGCKSGFALAENALTLYGPAGARVAVEVYTRPIAPFAGVITEFLDANGTDKVSIYAKNAAPGDTAVLVDAAGRLILSGLGPAVPTTPGLPTTPVTGGGAFTAAGATVGVIGAAVGVTGFLSGLIITAVAPAATVAGTITINNLAQGAVTLDFVETSSAGGQLVVPLPYPLAANATNTVISVTVPAITGGAAGHVQGWGYRA